ncbi:MAG: hypothetical protein JSV56_02165 [Methanomassiliicoccales archaeon]|nr:MAG: hypothetical protein JSV56_02165 [Methanomassiliicoccales archaeon]
MALIVSTCPNDILTFVRGLDKKEFTLKEMYGFEDRLQELHPDNRHVRDKIRQQMLRDEGGCGVCENFTTCIPTNQPQNLTILHYDLFFFFRPENMSSRFSRKSGALREGYFGSTSV